MNTIKTTSKLIMYTLTSDVNINSFKATLEAQIIVPEQGQMDIEFIDIINPSFNGMPITDWYKFKISFLEFGIDYDEMLNQEFDKIFTQERVEAIIG
jgi:hypothetical protein